MSAPLQARGDRETHLRWLHEMLRVRRFEERCAELYSAGKIRGFLHLYIGEEAIAVGAMPVFTPEDAVFATYREHGHAIARGLSMRAVMAEMFGKSDGCSRGRGGSMHLFDVSRRFYGGNAIVGGHLPVAAGLALADKLQGKRSVTACFFGEGAVAEGEFHETMNLAALWKLPILFLCENNRYAMGTALERSESETDVHLKAQAYRVLSEQVDGMDVFAVASAVKRAADAIRAEPGPWFIEFLTYRFRAHSMFDAELYRSKEEVHQWLERCPLRKLTASGRVAGVTEEELADLEAKVKAELDDAVAFADASPPEAVSELTRFVYRREVA